jgi:hypothetical protein
MNPKPIEIDHLGDDPHGRGEPTVFYRDPELGPGLFYCWVKLWPADWGTLPPVP